MTGAVWGFLTGALPVGAAPPAEPVEAWSDEPAPGDTPPVPASVDAGAHARINMLKTAEQNARNRTATSFVGLRG